MSNCDQVRALIDAAKRDDQSEQIPQEHLSDCAECKAYQALADASDRVLSRLHSELPAPTLSRAYASLRTRAEKERRTTLTAIVGMVVSLLAALWFLRQGWQPGVLILFCWFGASALVAWWSSRLSRRYLALGVSEDFLSDWEHDLRRKILIVKSVAVLVGVETCLLIAGLLVAGLPSDGAILLLGLSVILAVGVLYTMLIELPVLRGELSLIEKPPVG